MQSENKYIGDDKFKKFLEHYACPTSLSVVKMKFAGAICSPNLELRPADVISSLWPEDEQPRLETKTEAELFFKFFMGLWDEIYQAVLKNKVLLPVLSKNEKKELRIWCANRYDELENGFLEGFWGGRDDLKLSAYIAQIVDSLSQMADVYAVVGKKAIDEDANPQLKSTVEETDKMVQKAIGFIIENAVLPRFEQLQQTKH